MENLIKTIEKVSKPMQLIAFAIAACVIVIVQLKELTIDFASVFIMLLPLVLIVLIIQTKILNNIKRNGIPALLIVIILILLSFGLSFFAFASTFKETPIIDRKSTITINKASKERQNQQLSSNIEIDRTLNKSFSFLNELYKSSINNCYREQNSTNINLLLSIKSELENIISFESKILGESYLLIYGDNQIDYLIKKLSASLRYIENGSYVEDIMYRVIGKKGVTYGIEEIVDTTNWKIPLADYENISQIKFSRVEKVLIQALGRDILTKRINEINIANINTIISGFNKLNVLNSNFQKSDNAIALKKFKYDLVSIFENDSVLLNKKFYELAFLNYEYQIRIYHAILGTEIIDPAKLIIELSKSTERAIAESVIRKELELFNIEDLNKLTLLLSNKLDKTNNSASRILLSYRDQIINEFTKHDGLDKLLLSGSTAELFLSSQRYDLYTHNRSNRFSYNKFFFGNNTRGRSTYIQLFGEFLDLSKALSINEALVYK